MRGARMFSSNRARHTWCATLHPTTTPLFSSASVCYRTGHRVRRCGHVGRRRPRSQVKRLRAAVLGGEPSERPPPNAPGPQGGRGKRGGVRAERVGVRVPWVLPLGSAVLPLWGFSVSAMFGMGCRSSLSVASEVGVPAPCPVRVHHLCTSWLC